MQFVKTKFAGMCRDILHCYSYISKDHEDKYLFYSVEEQFSTSRSEVEIDGMQCAISNQKTKGPI